MMVSISDDDGHARLIVGRDGDGPRAAIIAIAAEIDELNEGGDSWLIDAVSSPQTIYRDLQGHREQVKRGHRSVSAGMPSSPASIQYAEEVVLGAIGRLDLWRRPGRRAAA